jgi:hypothetical protein
VRAARLVVLAVAIAGCGVSGWPPFEPAGELPPVGAYDGRPGPDGGIVLRPASVRVTHGVAYAFSLGHCGLYSPVDVDGAFWDALDGTDASGAPLDLETDSEMINATAGSIVIVGDELRFRTETGSTVRFARHAGEKEFPGCD